MDDGDDTWKFVVVVAATVVGVDSRLLLLLLTTCLRRIKRKQIFSTSTMFITSQAANLFVDAMEARFLDDVAYGYCTVHVPSSSLLSLRS